MQQKMVGSYNWTNLALMWTNSISAVKIYKHSMFFLVFIEPMHKNCKHKFSHLFTMAVYSPPNKYLNQMSIGLPQQASRCTV